MNTERIFFIVVFIYWCGQKHWYSFPKNPNLLGNKLKQTIKSHPQFFIPQSTEHMLLMHDLTYSRVNCNLFHGKLRFFLEKSGAVPHQYVGPPSLYSLLNDLLWEEITFFQADISITKSYRYGFLKKSYFTCQHYTGWHIV